MVIFSKQKMIFYIENFLIILCVSIVLNAIPNILFPGWRFMKHIGLLILLFLYYFMTARRNGLPSLGKQYGFISSAMLFPLFLGGISEFIRPVLKSTLGYNFGFVALICLVLFSTYQFFKSVYVRRSKFDTESNVLLSMVKPYFKLASYIVYAAIFVFVLIMIGGINASEWDLPSFYGEDFTNRLDKGFDHYIGDSYYKNPLGITVLMPNYVKLDTPLGAFGSFCGLSYEPHIGAFFAAPAFFMAPLFIKKKRNRILHYITFFLYFILAASTTNLLSFAAVLGVMLIHSFFRKPIGLIAGLFVVFVIFIINQDLILSILEPILNLIEKKTQIDSHTDSAGVSAGYIDYILFPKDLIGDGLFIVPDYRVNFIHWDIGYLYSFLYILHYVFIIISIIFILLSRSKFVPFAFAGIYYVAHSLKFPLHAIRYPFTIFIIFILSVSVHLILKKQKEKKAGVLAT